MAVAMTTFGSTLSDLQRLTNEDRAMDYQRANFQDQTTAQRLSEFLKARSEDNRTKSQRDAEAARLLDAQQARAQQGSQFNTQQQNLMAIEQGRNAADRASEAARAAAAIDLAKLQGANAVEIAKIQGANRQIDPRYFQTLAETQVINQEEQQKVDYAKQLSDTRKAFLREQGQIFSNKSAFDYGQPRNPRWGELNELISKLDAQAATLGLPLGPDGGYVVPAFKPIQVPAMFNQGVNPVAPAVVPPVQEPALAEPFPFLSTDAPPARTPAPPVRRFRVTPDGRTMVVP